MTKKDKNPPIGVGLYLSFFLHYGLIGAVLLTGPPLGQTTVLLTVEAFAFLGWLWTIAEMRAGKLCVFSRVHSNHRLVISGPYKILRHPLNAMELLIVTVVLVGYFTPIRILIFLMFLVNLMIKLNLTEDFFMRRWDSYSQYRSHTKKLIPLIF